MTTTDRQLTEREIKALQIAAKSKLTRKGNVWTVPGQAGHGEYEVNPDPQTPRCTCPDLEYTQARCKHIYAVEYVLERETTSDGQTVVTETVKVTRKTYSQNWPAYNAAQTHEKSELQAYLYELCKNLPEPVQRKGKGRPPLCLSDIIFSSVTKIYSTISGRRYQTDLREAKARGYLMHLPHYNSVFKYLESESLTPYLYELITLSAAPLKSIESDFAVDSSGFSTGQFMRWLDVKYGTKEDRRQWLKLHLMVGVKTNIVTSVEVSDGYAHDYPFYKGLVDHTAESGFQMKEVSADKALSRCRELAGYAAQGRDTLHSIQIELGSRLTRIVWSKVRTVDAHVSFLQSASCGVFAALSQAIKRRNYVPHDQVEVWSTVAKSNAHSTGQRSFM